MTHDTDDTRQSLKSAIQVAKRLGVSERGFAITRPGARPGCPSSGWGLCFDSARKTSTDSSTSNATITAAPAAFSRSTPNESHPAVVPRPQSPTSSLDRHSGSTLAGRVQADGDSILLCATLLSAECGMLLPEIVTLTWRHLDLLDGTLAVPSSTSARRSGGCECQHASRLNSKTGGAAPQVTPLTSSSPSLRAMTRPRGSPIRSVERVNGSVCPFPLVALRNALPGAR